NNDEYGTFPCPSSIAQKKKLSVTQSLPTHCNKNGFQVYLKVNQPRIHRRRGQPILPNAADNR
ncbi:hypothetical protein L9F63_017018, partial [Diploptera punctata]